MTYYYLLVTFEIKLSFVSNQESIYRVGFIKEIFLTQMRQHLEMGPGQCPGGVQGNALVGSRGNAPGSYLRQNSGKNSIMMANNSNRPSTIQKLKIPLAAPGRWPKLLEGPTSLNPNPTLPKVEAEADRAVSRSISMAAKAKVERIRVIR